jgi:hypothetical protein
MVGKRSRFALILGVGLTACGGEPPQEAFEEEDAPLTAERLPQVFRRTVIARAFQRGNWTLPNRDAEHVCTVFRQLKPTLVSGLIRLADVDELGDDQIAAYNAIRQCVNAPHANGTKHQARFDVVLNAMQYESADELVQKLGVIDQALKPDLYFFDFYQQGYADPKFRPAIQAAIRWIHEHAHAVVGGNVWATEVPPHSDFAAVDDRDGKSKPGFERMLKQVAGIKAKNPGMPVLAHIENNPNKDGNRGEKFMFTWDTAKRKEVITEQAAQQDAGRYWLMYPVFFPLTYRRDGEYAQYPAGFMVAYDASRDGNMLEKYSSLMSSYTNE